MKMANQTDQTDSKLIKSKTTLDSKISSLKSNQISRSPALTQSITFLSNYSDEDLEEEEPNSSMRSKFWSMWNNLKYGWNFSKLKPTFNLNNNEPIWLLGVCYMKVDKKQMYLSRQVNLKTIENLEIISLKDDPVKKQTNLVENQSNSSSSHHSSSGQSSPNSSELDLHSNELNVVSSVSASSVLESFKHDFYSRIWMTYRREFKKIPGSHFTSDCGWGCIIRSGQSLLAQALLSHFLQRSWRFTGVKSDKEDMIHRMLIKWFADDDNSTQSPFSVHQLVACGLTLGKKPGDWYGPSSVSYIMKNALEAAQNESNFVLDGVCIYVAQDCTVYLKDLIKLCTKHHQPSKYKSLSALKKDKTNNGNHYTTINGAMLSSNGHSYLKNRKRVRNSLKSLGSSIDLASDQFIEQTVKQKENSCSSAESNITSRNNSVNQSIDDVFANSVNVIDIKSSSSFNLSDALLNSQLKNTNSLSTNSSSSSSSSSTRSTKSNQSSRRSASSTLLNDLKKSNKRTKFKSVILLVPMRLGGEKFNPIYTNCIKKLFRSPYCIGIIGGKPRHSLYFVGVNEEKLICLDPHFCQETVDTNKTNFPLASYHCSTPRKLSISKLDPSCTIGFYCKTEQDLNNLIEWTRKEMIPHSQRINGQSYPVFIFDEVNSFSNDNTYYDSLNNNIQNLNRSNDGQIIKERLVKVRHQYLNDDRIKEIKSEDFVLI